MAPKHDEIVKDAGDGFVARWDSTHVDPHLRKNLRKVILAQRTALKEALDRDEISFEKRRGTSYRGD